MEYYFQDQLRWSFCFENPNKAAALIASVLPLLWVIAQSGWGMRLKWWKWAAASVGMAALCTGWWLLFMTFSRGGIAAAFSGFLYIGWSNRKVFSGARTLKRKCVALSLVLLVGALFVASSAAERSAHWIGKREGSVTNRLELWQGALRLIGQIPQGVGTGNSGLAYMQWFQPVNSTPRYRTLVNSYLTFASEQGIALFGVAVFAGVFIWKWSHIIPCSEWMRSAMIGARGSLVAFAVAGFFSTTMEERLLWGIPLLCVGLLFFGVWSSEKRCGSLRLLRVALLTSVVVCTGLLLIGKILVLRNPERIRLNKGEVEIAIARGSGRHFVTWVDEQVLGADYGKLLRALAVKSDARIRVPVEFNTDAVEPGETLIVTGDCVSRLTSVPEDMEIILIAPARVDVREARQILRGAKHISLFTPSFDDDGRAALWNSAAAESAIKPLVIDGVASQVESAWDQIVDRL